MLDTVVVYQALLWGVLLELGIQGWRRNCLGELFSFSVCIRWQADALEVTIQYDERGPWDPDALAFGEWCPGRLAVQTA